MPTYVRTLNRSAKDRLFSIVIPIETPTDRTYKIKNNTTFSFDVEAASYITASGTCSLDLRINSVSIGALSALSASSGRTVTSATTNKSMAVGSNLTLTVSSNSSTDMLNIVLTCRRTGLED